MNRNIPRYYPFVLFPGQHEMPRMPIEYRKPVKKLFMGYHIKLFDSSYESDLSNYNKYIRELYLYNEIIGSKENLAVYKNKILFECIDRVRPLGYIHEEVQRKGKTEKLFFDHLKKRCGDNIENDRKINDWFLFKGEFDIYQYSEKHGKPYIPDIVYEDDFERICIDIEIDEPYTLNDDNNGLKKSYKPIHFLGGDDEKRDDSFVFNNWVVLRFAEEQIVNNLEDCGKIVEDVVDFLKAINKNKGNIKTAFELETYDLDKVKRWTKLEAEEMAEKNYRDSYLSVLNEKFINKAPQINKTNIKDIKISEEKKIIDFFKMVNVKENKA